MRGRTAYLAGPTTGKPQRNIQAFLDGADRLVRDGFAVLLPADVGEVWTTACRTAAPSFDALVASVSSDMDAVLGADLLVTLPGSEDLFEVTLARAFGVPMRSLASFTDSPELTLRMQGPPPGARQFAVA